MNKWENFKDVFRQLSVLDDFLAHMRLARKLCFCKRSSSKSSADECRQTPAISYLCMLEGQLVLQIHVLIKLCDNSDVVLWQQPPINSFQMFTRIAREMTSVDCPCLRTPLVFQLCTTSALVQCVSV